MPMMILKHGTWNLLKATIKKRSWDYAVKFLPSLLVRSKKSSNWYDLVVELGLKINEKKKIRVKYVTQQYIRVCSALSLLQLVHGPELSFWLHLPVYRPYIHHKLSSQFNGEIPYCDISITKSDKNLWLLVSKGSRLTVWFEHCYISYENGFPNYFSIVLQKCEWRSRPCPWPGTWP